MQQDKETFVYYINKIKEHNEKIDAINDLLRNIGSDSTYIPSSLETELVSLLKELYHDTNKDFSLIEYYIYDLNFGKDWAMDSITIDEKSIPLSTPEELYEALISNLNPEESIWNITIVNLIKYH